MKVKRTWCGMVVLGAMAASQAGVGAGAQGPGQGISAGLGKAHKVVFVVTSGDEADWKMAVTNIRNMLLAFPPDSTAVEVVAFGPGLAMLHKGGSVQTEMTTLEGKQVRFLACENSMKAQHVTAGDLAEGVGTVPSGVVELVTKQEQGWSYIKAGR